MYVLTYIYMSVFSEEFSYNENGKFQFIEDSYKVKLTNWGKVAQSAGGMSQNSCPSYSKGKGKLLPDRIKSHQIDNC